jgi:hypothetical protein
MTKDWMTFYFLEPRPERFVEEVRSLAAQGILSDPERGFPSVVFLSCIIAANPSNIQHWFDELSDLSPADRRSLEVAAWFSRAPEARAYFATRPISEKFGSEPPDVLKMEIEHPSILDGLWGHYFATGDYRAVRRIVAALEYMSDFGAARSFGDSGRTEADQARALRDGIFQAAAWSLETLMRQHEPLKSFCGELVRSGQLTPNERLALAITLSKIDPTLWKVEIDPKTSNARIKWAVPGR